MKQLILCIETTKHANTDASYIEKTIKHFYCLDNTKLSYIFLEGKNKCTSAKIEKRIQKLKSYFVDNSVVFILDTDKSDVYKEIEQSNKEIERYCKERDYLCVWFCRTIEEVFLHKVVDDNQKVAEAKHFSEFNSPINKANEKSLSTVMISRYKSNLLKIIDTILKRKGS